MWTTAGEFGVWSSNGWEEIRACAQVYSCAPEGADELAEAGAAVRFVGPAAGQQGVECGWAVLGFGESNSTLQLVDHLPILQPEERLLGHWEDLPHTHTWLNIHTNTCTIVLNLYCFISVYLHNRVLNVTPLSTKRWRLKANATCPITEHHYYNYYYYYYYNRPIAWP